MSQDVKAMAEALKKAEALAEILDAIRADQVSISMGFGKTAEDRTDRRRQLADYIHGNADDLDERLEEFHESLRTLAALSTYNPIPEEKGQIAWLLEWPASDNMPTRWWNPTDGWMIDANTACWFAREADAESYKKQSRMHGCIVSTEHVFGLSPNPIRATGEGLNIALDKAEQDVVQQACEDVGGCGASDELREAVLRYYQAAGDDELAEALAEALGLASSPLRGEGSQNNSALPPVKS